jgi:dihydroneopterin aldolase/2-amino-4-hydroxy-6-hydroxymethyldihydropteridine diphosphokinase/dihydropteroate synthase
VPTEQLISISLSIFYDVSKTAETDDLKYSINYSEIANRIRNAVASKTFFSLQDLARSICQSMDSSGPLSPSDDAPGSEIRVKVKQLKAPLHAKTVAIEHLAKRMPNGSWTHRKINHIVEDLTCPIIVGINPAERLERQNVVVNLSVDTGDQGLERGYWLDFRNLIKVLYEVCRIFFFFRRNMSKSLFNRICQCQTSRRLRR